MSDNRTSNEKTATPRLSLRIPRNLNQTTTKTTTVSFRESDLMSPRTTIVSNPSSSIEISKEVPRAALLLSQNSPPSTSDFAGVSDLIEMTTNTEFKDEDHQNLVEDSILGLKALAASAVASESRSSDIRVSSPPESRQLDEVEFLGKLFNYKVEEEEISKIFNENCTEIHREEGKKKIYEIIEKADNLLSSNGIAMSLKNILPFYIKKLVEQEILRTGQKEKDLTGLLINENFLSASATVILLIPRLVSCIVSVEQVSTALNSNLFDVLLTIETVLKVLPDLMKLEEIQIRMKQLQEILLESLIWKVKREEENFHVFYKLLKSEFKGGDFGNSSTIQKTLTGIRSVQKALETLSGFPSIGSRVTRLEIFFRKYLRLASQRIQLATQKLGLNNSVKQFAWELFYDLIKSEGQSQGQADSCSEMFKNRHLNQILLATIYCSAELFGQERSFQQICKVLPSSQSNTTWLTKVSIGNYEGDSCDFYTFYNEIFVPTLRKRIESFLNRFKDELKDEHWILNELFTTAPFPQSPSHQIASNVTLTLNRLNQPKPKNQNTSIKYEWFCPYTPTAMIPTVIVPEHQQQSYNQRIPQTPSNTSQLLNIPTTSFYSEHDFKRRLPPLSAEEEEKTTDESKEFRLKKVARRLDFSEESS